MKILGWVLLVFWVLGALTLLMEILGGQSPDAWTTNIGALALIVAQIFFNYKVAQKLK